MKPRDIGEYDEAHIVDQPSGLIIKSSVGELWTNQAGGSRCSHPVERGFYFPLPPVNNPFHDGFCFCHRGLDRTFRKQLEKKLNDIGMMLSGDNLDKTQEAWIHVVLHCGLHAVLTYGNCD